MRDDGVSSRLGSVSPFRRRLPGRAAEVIE
jgi:hypothetical protein